MLSGSLRQAACAGALVVLLAGARAAATPLCSSLPNPMYFSGSASSLTILENLAVKVGADAIPTTYVFQPSASCGAIATVLSDLNPTTTPNNCASPGCITGTAEYFTTDPTSGQVVTNPCTLDAAGDHVDVALSDLFTSSCPSLVGDATKLLDVLGPVHATVFVTPQPSIDANTLSFPRSISAQQAYFVLGFPMGGAIAPWINPMRVFLQDPTETSEIIMSDFIGVPPALMLGTDVDDNLGDTGVLQAIDGNEGLGVQNLNQDIGIMSGALYDQHRATELQALAFAVVGQTYAYYPDQTSTSFEKQNVRDGHYVPWTYLHAFVRVTPSGSATTVNAKNFVAFFSAATPLDGYSIQDAALDSHLIPVCAMGVQREFDGPDLQRYSDPAPCDCWYGSRASGGTAPLGCNPCATTANCASGQVCRSGFCEAH